MFPCTRASHFGVTLCLTRIQKMGSVRETDVGSVRFRFHGSGALAFKKRGDGAGAFACRRGEGDGGGRGAGDLAWQQLTNMAPDKGPCRRLILVTARCHGNVGGRVFGFDSRTCACARVSAEADFVDRCVLMNSTL